jgi:hypothetical protein
VCDLYDADGLYVIDSTVHSPLIGYAYDGFPIYGAYGFKNADGTGGVTRIKSGYQLRNITARTIWADGTDVPDGPVVSTTFPLGYFREDYEFISHGGQEDYLDIHNGRVCVTPEYPNGIYCYFTTVNEEWNSAYPYVVGPTFYGVKTAAKVNAISETVTTYTSNVGINELKENDWSVYPNPSNDIIMVQVNDLTNQSYTVELYDALGKLIQSKQIIQGSTIAYLQVDTLYKGLYQVKISGQAGTKKLVIE